MKKMLDSFWQIFAKRVFTILSIYGILPKVSKLDIGPFAKIGDTPTLFPALGNLEKQEEFYYVDTGSKAGNYSEVRSS